MPPEIKTIATGTLHRVFQLDREQVNADNRTVELSFSSETPVDRWFGPVYEAWLTMALSFGLIVVQSAKRGPSSRLSAANFDKYSQPLFVGRGWEWVDPVKDEQANTEALANNLTTRSRIAAERGEDFEEILAERAQENQMAADYNIDLDADSKKVLHDGRG